jgi:hypothetical protein
VPVGDALRAHQSVVRAARMPRSTEEAFSASVGPMGLLLGVFPETWCTRSSYRSRPNGRALASSGSRIRGNV